MWEKTHVRTFRGLFPSREISRSEGEFFSVNKLRTASLFGYKYHFVCKRLFSWKLEYIFGEIYCLHQVISLGNEMATRSSCIKLQYVEENGCPNFRGLFTRKLIKSHVKLQVKSDAQTEVLRPVSLFGYKYQLCLQTVGSLIWGDGHPLNKDTLSRLCSSRARWSLASNFCSCVNRKSQTFHTN